MSCQAGSRQRDHHCKSVLHGPARLPGPEGLEDLPRCQMGPGLSGHMGRLRPLQLGVRDGEPWPVSSGDGARRGGVRDVNYSITNTILVMKGFWIFFLASVVSLSSVHGSSASQESYDAVSLLRRKSHSKVCF